MAEEDDEVTSDLVYVCENNFHVCMGLGNLPLFEEVPVGIPQSFSATFGFRRVLVIGL